MLTINFSVRPALRLYYQHNWNQECKASFSRLQYFREEKTKRRKARKTFVRFLDPAKYILSPLSFIYPSISTAVFSYPNLFSHRSFTSAVLYTNKIVYTHANSAREELWNWELRQAFNWVFLWFMLGFTTLLVCSKLK